LANFEPPPTGTLTFLSQRFSKQLPGAKNAPACLQAGWL
jgi:hypothetical protein